MLSTKIPPIARSLRYRETSERRFNSEDALKNTSVIVHAIPLQSMEQFLYDVIEHIPTNGRLCSCRRVKASKRKRWSCRVTYWREFCTAKGEEQTTEERKVGVFERTDVCETVNQRNAVWGGDGGENVGVVEEGVRVFASPAASVLSVHGRRGVCVGGRVEERGGDFSRWFRGDGVWCERGGVISNEGL